MNFIIPPEFNFQIENLVVGMSGLNWSPSLRWHSRCFSQMVMNNLLPLLITAPVAECADDSVLLSLVCKSQQREMWAAGLGSDLGTKLVCTVDQCPGSGEFCPHKCLGGKGVKSWVLDEAALGSWHHLGSLHTRLWPKGLESQGDSKAVTVLSCGYLL